MIHLTPFQIASAALPLLVAGRLRRQLFPDSPLLYSTDGVPCVIDAGMTRVQARNIDEEEGLKGIDHLITHGKVTVGDDLANGFTQRHWMMMVQEAHDFHKFKLLERLLISALP